MTIDKTRELLTIQTSMSSGYNQNSAMLIMAEIQQMNGRMAVNQLIREMDLEAKFTIKASEKLLFNHHCES